MTDQQSTFTDFLLQFSLLSLRELDERLEEDLNQARAPYPLTLWQKKHSWWQQLAKRLGFDSELSE